MRRGGLGSQVATPGSPPGFACALSDKPMISDNSQHPAVDHWRNHLVLEAFLLLKKRAALRMARLERRLHLLELPEKLVDVRLERLQLDHLGRSR